MLTKLLAAAFATALLFSGSAVMAEDHDYHNGDDEAVLPHEEDQYQEDEAVLPEEHHDKDKEDADEVRVPPEAVDEDEIDEVIIPEEELQDEPDGLFDEDEDDAWDDDTAM